MVQSLLESLIVILPLLGSIAFMTLAERKIMGSMQRRVGPNIVGYYGVLQPIADGIKLILKEQIIPVYANRSVFLIAPLLSLITAILGWAVIPFGTGAMIADLSLGLLYSLAISSLGVYGVVFAGWAANTKYTLLGSLRSTAQMISYEVIMGLAILPVVMLADSLNYTAIVESQRSIWYIIPLLPIALIFFISILAETNRAPFDLPEAESELVSGFMTEHAAAPFVMFFLAEYASIILISSIFVILFCGGYLVPSFGILPYDFLIWLEPVVLGLKLSIILFIFIWIRASFPRLRYDQLMTLCWCCLLPLALAFFFLISSIAITFNSPSPPLNELVTFSFFPSMVSLIKKNEIINNDKVDIKYINNRKPSFFIPAPFIPHNFSPWFLTLRTLTTKREVFVYTKSEKFFIYPSSSVCAKALKVSRTTIRRALKEAQPYKDYYFSLSPVQPEYLHNIGFYKRTNPPINKCKSLIIWGSPGSLVSSIGLGMFPPKISNIIIFPPYIEGILIGLLLSDAWIQFASVTNKNARLGFKQSMINFSYFWHVFTLLSHYCSDYPNLTSSVRYHKQSFGIQFQTRSLPCFTKFHSLFYVKNVKVVPSNIYNLLTPVALAHWVMGDGMKDRKGLILCTDSYRVEEVVKLMNVLMIRYRLECTLRFLTPTQPRIYIRVKSMPSLQSIVIPHMHPHMLYKIQY